MFYVRLRSGPKITENIKHGPEKTIFFFAIKGLLLDSYCSDMKILTITSLERPLN